MGGGGYIYRYAHLVCFPVWENVYCLILEAVQFHSGVVLDHFTPIYNQQFSQSGVRPIRGGEETWKHLRPGG